MLDIRQLSCERGQQTLFEDLNLTVPAGQWVHLQGANGSGKTSLLRILAGLSPPTHGTVLWCGRALSDPDTDYPSQRLYLGHSLGLKDDLSVLENLQFNAIIAGHDLSTQHAMAALSIHGLHGREHASLRTLSQGQKRRCALARLQPGQFKLWLLDEPFVALDRSAVTHLQDVMAQHVQRDGTVVFSSHQDVCLPGLGQTLQLQP